MAMCTPLFDLLIVRRFNVGLINPRQTDSDKVIEDPDMRALAHRAMHVVDKFLHLFHSFILGVECLYVVDHKHAQMNTFAEVLHCNIVLISYIEGKIFI